MGQKSLFDFISGWVFPSSKRYLLFLLCGTLHVVAFVFPFFACGGLFVFFVIF